jgi:hypothetical protein
VQTEKNNPGRCTPVGKLAPTSGCEAARSYGGGERETLYGSGGYFREQHPSN